MSIRIEMNESKDKAYIFSPYNKEFIERIKKEVKSAKWDKQKTAWTVSPDDLVAARIVMKTTYGYTDLEPITKLLKIKVTLDEDVRLFKRHGAVVMFGKTIADGGSWGSDAKLGKDIVFLEGMARCGGMNRTNQGTEIEGPAVFTIRNVPEGIFNGDKEYWEEEGLQLEVIEEETLDVTPWFKIITNITGDDQSSIQELRKAVVEAVKKINETAQGYNLQLQFYDGKTVKMVNRKEIN